MSHENRDEAALARGSALAALKLAQLSFLGLVREGVLDRIEAEQMLRDAIASSKAGGPDHQIAAQILKTFERKVAGYRPPAR